MLPYRCFKDSEFCTNVVMFVFNSKMRIRMTVLIENAMFEVFFAKSAAAEESFLTQGAFYFALCDSIINV